MSPSITLERVVFPTPYMERVIALHAANARTLGFFPRGAFEEYAKRRQIIVASTGDDLLGYLLYRVGRGRAIVVHLCVANEARGRGVARQLIERMKQETKTLEGVGLHCRRDYEVNHFWPKFGFEAVNSKAGRGKDGGVLTFWWFSHGHADLFSSAAEPDPVRQQVGIDANIFYDLTARNTRESEDTKALLADWVQANIELVVTKELRNEIEKSPDEEQRRASRAEATRFTTLSADDGLFQRLCAELRALFPESATTRDEADLRQISYAIAGGASFFVTRDQTLIERCEPLYLSHGLTVLQPAEMINHLDSIEREADYKPAYIEGSRLKNQLLKADALDSVVAAFKLPEERINDFSKTLLRFLSQPKTADVQVISDDADAPIVLGVMDRQNPTVLAVPVLRRTSHTLAPTMLRNFLRACLDCAATENRNTVTVRLVGLSRSGTDVLTEFGFILCGEVWVKLALRVVGDLGDISQAVNDLVMEPSLAGAKHTVTSALTEAIGVREPAVSSAIERRLWPAKVTGIDVPTFIVSIRPGWAQHFFDVKLGSQLLFGLREDLHLGVEGVYYRSAENNNLRIPGRILWYVSKGDGDGSMSIKACSQLEEVVVGKRKELFRRFRRLGVFEWRDVYAAANQDISKDIAAFRFRMTERFKAPVDTKALKALGIRGPIMSPREITEAQFASVYRSGCALI